MHFDCFLTFRITFSRDLSILSHKTIEVIIVIYWTFSLLFKFSNLCFFILGFSWICLVFSPISNYVLVTYLAYWPWVRFPWWLSGKESACNAGDLGLIPGLGRSPGEGNGYPLRYSGLENSMDCMVHGVAKSWT